MRQNKVKLVEISDAEVAREKALIQIANKRNIADLADPGAAPAGGGTGSSPSGNAGGKAPQQVFFFRKDKLDTSIYNNNPGASSAEGGSITIAHNAVTDETTAGVLGVASLVIARNPDIMRPVGSQGAYISGEALAAWANIDWSRGAKTPSKNDDKLIPGLDGQFELYGNPLFYDQVFTFSPSYQTDFEGKAAVYGLTASWQPYNTSIALGSYQGFGASGFTWALQGLVDARDVARRGGTQLVQGSKYLWTGIDVKATTWFFPEQTKFKLYGVLQETAFWDTLSGRNASLFAASLNYNIGNTGLSSVALSYTKGVDHTTLKYADALTLGLKVKY
jgi:hypothetical protein